MKKWRVRGGFYFPWDKSAGTFLGPGTIFEARADRVKEFGWMVEELDEVPPPTPPPPPLVVNDEEDEEVVEREKVERPRRRGRPPKRLRAFSLPPEDRAIQ